MTEHEVETWVRNLAHEIPESSPPANLGATLRTARARGRRTMLLASIGAVAAVGLIGVGAAVAFQDDAAEDGSNVVATDGGSNSPAVDEKLVGWGRAVVSVPADWPVVSDICTLPATDHVFWYSDERATATCLSQTSPPGVALGLGALDSAVGHELTNAVADAGSDVATTVDGERVLDPGPNCAKDGNYCTEWFGLPDEDVFFSVTVSEPNAEAALTPIRQSLAILPSDQVAVPFIASDASYDQARAILEAAGLRLATAEADAPPSIGATDPAMASVVAVGSAVQLKE